MKIGFVTRQRIYPLPKEIILGKMGELGQRKWILDTHGSKDSTPQHLMKKSKMKGNIRI
jgi:hypothetical protein